MRSLQRVMRILETVARSNEPVGAARVTEATGLSLSTVSRLMQDLAGEAMLVRSARDGTYELGPKLFELARDGSRNADPVTAVRPLLRELRDVTEETTSLHVRNQGRRVCVAEVQSTHEVRRVVPLGLALPLIGTATGEILLAGAPEQEREREISESGLSATEEEGLRSRLQRLREQGWALVSDESLKGVTGLSVAVVDQGVTIAALSVSGPSDRFTEDVALSHLATVREFARRVEDRMAPPV